jgi:hypothetical protein
MRRCTEESDTWWSWPCSSTDVSCVTCIFVVLCEEHRFGSTTVSKLSELVCRIIEAVPSVTSHILAQVWEERNLKSTSAALLMVLITSASNFQRKFFKNSKLVCLYPSVIKVSFYFMSYIKYSLILSCTVFQKNTSGNIKVKRAMDSRSNMVQGSYVL